MIYEQKKVYHEYYNLIHNSSKQYVIAKSQNNIQDRCYHSAVLTIDGRMRSRNNILNSPSLIVLNTTSFEWRSPEYFGKNEPPNLCLHSANLVGNYMIIRFASPETAAIPLNESDQPPISVGAIVGITVGAEIALGLLLFFGIYYYRNRSPNFYVSGSQK
ncbi:hypothetical protein Glove_21g271 [Diversispora epigaea]|uniref:Uncharacterized protein n=1 Tax=Diversispora epigaea TaxID=1348612 RepID=A0A397JN25_9GLOM|nr:hypothetical protein Glove_21g271 [Diversispora epigaea]